MAHVEALGVSYSVVSENQHQHQRPSPQRTQRGKPGTLPRMIADDRGLDGGRTYIPGVEIGISRG